MKQSVKTIVDSIEKEIIDTILKEVEKQDYNLFAEFQYGSFDYDVSFNTVLDKYAYHYDPTDVLIRIEVKSVTVTNENSKVLTNLSNEVFNQLETTYTNY